MNDTNNAAETQSLLVDHEGLIENQSKLLDLNKRARELKSDIKSKGEYLADVKSAIAEGQGYGDAANRERCLAMYVNDISALEAKLATLLPRIAELEAKRPVVDRYTEVLEGLKGNIVEKVKNAIEVVIASEEYGTWIPHGSRKVHGLVDKKGSGKNWAAFVAAVKALDESRAKATFVVDPTKVSPTVRKTLDGLNLDSKTIRVCPMEYRDEEILLPSGKRAVVKVAYLNWPKGTKHGCSRFHATNNNFQCQACGHAIKNNFNWVPVLVDNKAGVPHSIWVGRDCAKNLFGIELVGALRLAEGQR